MGIQRERSPSPARCGDNRRIDVDVALLRSPGPRGDDDAAALIQCSTDDIGADDRAADVGGEGIEIIETTGAFDVDRDVDRIQQPGASLAPGGGGIGGAADAELLLAGGFDEAAVAALAAAAGADGSIHPCGPIRPHHHGAALAIGGGIGEDAAGPIHQGGFGIGPCAISPAHIAAHQHGATTGWCAHIEVCILEGHVGATHLHPTTGCLDAGSLQQHVAALGIQQQALIDREQTSGQVQIAVLLQPKRRQGSRIAHRAGQTLHRCAVQQRRLACGGARRIEHPFAHAPAHGGAEVQLLDVGEAAGPAQADAAGGEPHQIGGAREIHQLVDEATGGAGHRHEHIRQPAGVHIHAGDRTTRIKGCKTVKQISARRRASTHLAKPDAAAAAHHAVHSRAKAQGTRAGRHLTGQGRSSNHKRGSSQQQRPEADGPWVGHCPRPIRSTSES